MPRLSEHAIAQQRMIDNTIQQYRGKTAYQRTLDIFNFIREKNTTVIQALDREFPDILNGRAYEREIQPNPNLGITPLMFALQMNRTADEQVVDTLLASRNIDLFVKDRSGRNILFQILATGIDGKYIKKVLDKEPCLFRSTYVTPITQRTQNGGSQRGGDPREKKPLVYITSIIRRMRLTSPNNPIVKAKQALIEWYNQNQEKLLACPSRPVTPSSSPSGSAGRSRRGSRSGSPRGSQGLLWGRGRMSRTPTLNGGGTRRVKRGRGRGCGSPRGSRGVLWGRERMSRTPILGGGGSRRNKHGGGCGCGN